MKKLIGALAVVGLPIVALATLQAAAPVFADTPGTAPACVSQSLNPHPTDPAGTTTATLFCTAPTPTPTPTATTQSGGSGGHSGSGGAGASGAGTTGGGSQTTLANSAGTGSASTPVGQSTAAKSSTGNASQSSGGLFGGLVGFFSATGGLVFLFALLILMAIVLIAIGVVSWLRRDPVGAWASRARSLSFRPKS
jgi:cobalamin biosynthesis Mg chelatase CobN